MSNITKPNNPQSNITKPNNPQSNITKPNIPNNPQRLSQSQILQLYLEPHHAIDPAIIGFIMEYVTCFHVTEAAKAANLTVPQAKKILNKLDVQETIRQLTLDMKSVTSQEIIERANEIAQVDPADIFNKDGTVRDIYDIPPAVRRSIKKITVKELWEKDINGISEKVGVIKNIEFWSKDKAIEILGKNEGLFKDTVKHEHDIGSNLAAILLSSEKRAIDAANRDTISLRDDQYQNMLAIKANAIPADEDL